MKKTRKPLVLWVVVGVKDGLTYGIYDSRSRAMSEAKEWMAWPTRVSVQVVKLVEEETK